MRTPWALLAAGSIAMIGAGGPSQPAGAAKPSPWRSDGVAIACVKARPHWNRTGIRLQRDRKYLITAQGTWWDKQYRHGPAGGESPNGTLKMFERFRRVPDANWFELICALDSQKSKTYRVGCRRELVAPVDGELICYANDVWLFYCNNSGTIEMTVKQLD